MADKSVMYWVERLAVKLVDEKAAQMAATQVEKKDK